MAGLVAKTRMHDATAKLHSIGSGDHACKISRHKTNDTEACVVPKYRSHSQRINPDGLLPLEHEAHTLA